jgi:hypothetical protein
MILHDGTFHDSMLDAWADTLGYDRTHVQRVREWLLDPFDVVFVDGEWLTVRPEEWLL